MKTKLLTIIGFLLLIACAGCGAGAGAPPVDLPAPITGRVDVSAPDDAGNIAITGTAGAVDGSVLVMAVDETGSGVLSLRFLDLLISPASAAGEVFPPICDTQWHACSYAATDGSFTIYLQAAIGDAIAIGVIDVTSGAFISELLRVTVPESGTPSPTANCAGQGVAGEIADLKIAPTTGTPLLLRKGSDATTNSIAIGSGSGTAIAITGCHAYALAVQASATGDIVVATSKEDKVLWAGRLANGVMRDRRSFALEEEPMHAAFTSNYVSAPIVAVAAGSTVELRRFSLADGSALESKAISTTPPPLTQSIALRVMPMEGDTAMGLLVTFNSTPTDAYVTLFQADKLAKTYTIAMNDLSSTLLSIVDAWLYADNPATPEIRFALLDSASTENQLMRFTVRYDAGGIPAILMVTNSTADFTEWWLPAAGVADHIASGRLRHIVTTELTFGSSTKAIVSKDDLHISYMQNITDNGVDQTWPGGGDITLMAIDQANKKLFGMDAATGLVTDGSSLLGW